MTTDHTTLAHRLRTTLATEPSIREVRMFGGLSFMVNNAIVVAAGHDGDLLVRVDPERSRELIALPGARPAEMGAGRVMGTGWISVAHDAVTADEQLSFWIEVAMEYNARAGRSSR